VIGSVAAWQQEGKLFVWRYAEPRRAWCGWQFAADPAGARSIRNLIDRMQGGEACHRTLRLDPVTDSVLAVPNAGYRPAGRFDRLRLDYRPELDALSLTPDGDMLIRALGGRGARKLAAAFASVEIGDGDFGIAPSDEKRAAAWMFWWMSDVNYTAGRFSR
jgi:hypothetical protein